MSEWKAPKSISELYAKAGIREKPNAEPNVQKALEKGNAPYQLYSLATPNGKKIGIMLEELEVQYDAHLINILAGDQKTSGFLEISPNGLIPALVDNSAKNSLRLFESGSILIYLADKHKRFIPPIDEVESRAEVTSWLMWQVGSGPAMGQLYMWYVAYADVDPAAREVAIGKFGAETQRLFSVLDKQLSKSKSGYVCDWGYSIADIAIWPFIDGFKVLFTEFLSLQDYKHVMTWAEKVGSREAVKKGAKVNEISYQ